MLLKDSTKSKRRRLLSVSCQKIKCRANVMISHVKLWHKDCMGLFPRISLYSWENVKCSSETKPVVLYPSQKYHKCWWKHVPRFLLYNIKLQKWDIFQQTICKWFLKIQPKWSGMIQHNLEIVILGGDKRVKIKAR